MRDIIKLGLLSLIISLTFTACMEDNPETVTKKYMEALKDENFNEVSKVVSEDMKNNLSNNIFVNCIINPEIKDEVIPKLEEKKIDIDEYNNLSSDKKNKIINECFKSWSKSLDNMASYKILFSKVNEKSKDAIVSLEIKLRNGSIKQEFITLKKFNDEWKVIE
ncbi:DUF4878 domain-containing protein [Aliarcobacter butzleri]|uniref:DUF4878 domain-containing protein n=1 Tax=Aliarcobacter butzleri TaxID=28197 RepID=UPI0021B3170C|nr:DUF4878 domain-containing protein [Aliarcobacter butzleri]MCT7596673.1 DUF4878 domain-containing protein [Aliarcobacter butzleri]